MKRWTTSRFLEKGSEMPSPLGFVFCALVSVGFLALSIGVARASTGADSDRYKLSISSNEARESLNGILSDLNEVSASQVDPTLRSELAKLVRSYRLAPSGAPQNQFTTSIKDAPFPFMIIGEKANELYPSAYDQEWTAQHDKIVNNIPLETIFDGFMDGVANDSLPDSLKASAKQIGHCLAKKALRGKGPGCELDPSDHVKKVGKLKLAWMKLTCRMNFVSSCDIRQAIYNAAKPQLIEARKSPEIRAMAEKAFQERFPVEFRAGFLDELASRIKAFPSMIAEKFNGTPSELWGDQVPLIEGDSLGAGGKLTMHEFVSGFRADLRMAALLADSPVPEERGLAAPLFYAAANRLLILTGGKKAGWTGSQFVLDVNDKFDPAQPKKAPLFQNYAFGGWAMFSNGSYGNWDWAGYSSSSSSAGALFPSELTLSRLGLPVTGAPAPETLADLAELLTASVEFLQLTRPGTALWKHFADTQSLDKILDPKSPAIFPMEGRSLAVGIIAAVLKNLLAPTGHVEMREPGGTGAKLGVAFHDLVGATGRDSVNVPVVSLSKLLVAASDLRQALGNDPAVPAELLAVEPQLGQAVQVGALSLSSDAQAPDGGFYERLGIATQSDRTLNVATAGILAMTRAYNTSKMLVLRLSIKLGWDFLDRFWGNSLIPQSSLGDARLMAQGALSPAELWNLLKLWDETQRTVRADLADEVDWNKWARRFENLRQALLQQLKTEKGPAPLGGTLR